MLFIKNKVIKPPPPCKMQTCQSHTVKITENRLWTPPPPAAPALLDIPPGKKIYLHLVKLEFY